MPARPVEIDRLVAESFVARVEHHRVLASTNDLAKQRAAERFSPLPLLIVADQQTAGRGRGSNRWWTGTGSLAFSLLVETGRWQIAPQHVPMIALAAGLAVIEAVRPALSERPVGLHWPNDVFAEGRKLAGTLIEGPKPGLHVIGIGVNTNCSLAEAPEELRASATSLRDLTGRWHDHTGLLVRLLQQLDGLTRQMTRDPDAVGRLADQWCLQRGRMLRVEVGGRVVTGVCAGIAPDGALLLNTDRGRQACYSGTVRELGEEMRGGE